MAGITSAGKASAEKAYTPIFLTAATKMDPNLCTKLSASFSQASDVVSWLAAPFWNPWKLLFHLPPSKLNSDAK